MVVADRHRDTVSLAVDGFLDPSDGVHDLIDGVRDPSMALRTGRRPTPRPPRRPDEHLL